MSFALGIKDPFDVTVQRPHDADPGQHRWPAVFGYEDQRLHGGLPFRRGVLGFRQLRGVVSGIPQGEKPTPLGSGIGSSNGVNQGNKNTQAIILGVSRPAQPIPSGLPNCSC
jgi:hypothetical protein